MTERNRNQANTLIRSTGAGFSLLIQLYPDDDLRAWRCAYVNLHVADILGGEDAMPDIPIPDRIRKALQRLPVCGSGKVMQIILKMK